MLRAAAAAALDAELFTLYSLDQLMEQAGLAVALAVADAFPLLQHPSVLLLCGPGNNGGDGLVAARHLRALGYAPTVLCPRPSPSAHYARLLAQLRALRVPVHAEAAACPPLASFHCAVDAVLGFSSRLPLRPPFDALLRSLAASGLPVLSVDVPTGWEVDQHAAPTAAADASQLLQPAALLSLTAPKPCAEAFLAGGASARRHYLGLCDVVPPEMRARYGLGERVQPTPGLSSLARLA